MQSLETLPTELIFNILSLQGGDIDIIKLCQINKQFQQLCQDDYFWRFLYQYSGFPPLLLNTNVSWKEKYSIAYQYRDLYDQLTDIKLNSPDLLNKILIIQEWFKTNDVYLNDETGAVLQMTPFILIVRPVGKLKDDTVYKTYGDISPYFEDSRLTYNLVMGSEGFLHLPLYNKHIRDEKIPLLKMKRVVTSDDSTYIKLTIEEFISFDFSVFNYHPSALPLLNNPEITLTITTMANNITTDRKSRNRIKKIYAFPYTEDYINDLIEQLDIITQITRIKLILLKSNNVYGIISQNLRQLGSIRV